MLTFSIFIFLSLAIVKRYTELLSIKGADEKATKGRGYLVSDMGLLCSMGVAAGYLSVLVLALFIVESQMSQKYNSPELLWLMIPVLLYWISRTWIIVHRGIMHDDPIVFALKDQASRYIGALSGAIVASAIWL